MTDAQLAAGASIAGQAMSAYSAAQTNRQQRRWQEKMYEMQRAHSLEDRDWQANYNSPAAQMARLKAAGLNPNLVYGNGATQDAPAIRSSQVGSWNPEPPRFDGGSVMGSYMDTKIRSAQADNLKAQNKIMESQNAYIQAQTLGVIESTKGKTFSNAMNSQLAQNMVEMKDALLQKLRADIDMSVHGNRRQDELNTMTITSMKDNLKTAAIQRLQTEANTAKTQDERRKISEEISAIRQGTYNARIDGELKDLEKERQVRGGSVSDPWYIKRLDAIAQKLGFKWKK